MAQAQAEFGRRLGREQRYLSASIRRAWAIPEPRVPDRLGASGPVRRGRGPFGRRATRRRILDAHATGRRTVERPQFHGARLSTRVLFEISRLFGVFPDLGAGGLPHTDASRNRSLTSVLSRQ